MKTAALSASLAMLLLLAGCTTTQMTWSKVGATQEQGNKDIEACADQAGLMTRQVGGMVETGTLLGRSFKEGEFEKCMTGKGYRKN